MNGWAWKVSEAGYGWELPKDGGGTPVLVVSRPWPNRVYVPAAEQPALFRVFAELAPEPQAMLDFANAYGHLGDFLWLAGGGLAPDRAGGADPLNDALVRRTGLAPDRLGRERAETVSFWKAQIEAMRAPCLLWERVAEGKDDPDLTARVAEAVDQGCRERVECRFSYDARGRTAGWSRTPVDLLGALWLQFADTVAGNKRTRRCSVCDRWFLVATGAGRTDKEHCSLACRQKAYRKRKQDAIDLYATGMHPREIASKLGSDFDTVKGWLKGQSGGENSTDDEVKPLRPGLDL
ncbi:IS1 family transposase [Urbifossiella limnaea]|uniref:Uncharacterized protein n=1 Tax=Urbifossiella limnaea TaxID=2528023 RepID=A0A517XV37_9BACT|nr:IS1 family transposase [Urbifossiella limnaea]QDU21380.1 hypothetical protein ETAA1_33470 [Urbifossiella limnaea]